MPEKIQIHLNGSAHTVDAGTSVAAAILNLGEAAFRKSVGHSGRGPVCGMGICQECRVKVNGAEHQRACMLTCEAGMEIETDV